MSWQEKARWFWHVVAFTLLKFIPGLSILGAK